MRITKREYKSLVSHIRKQSSSDVSLVLKIRIVNLDPEKNNCDLNTLGPENLLKLIQLLPHGHGTSLTSPVLTEVKKKARTSLAGLRVPHLDPESWPQIYRMQMRLNNNRGGIKAGPLGQYYKLNPKGLSLRPPLRGERTWTTTEAGDLHIMGPWADVIRMLGSSGAIFTAKFGDMFDNDVNVEFDRMYGAPKGDAPGWFEHISAVPLYVSVSNGALFSKTDNEGEVVLNAPGEIVALVGKKITGIAGAAGPTGFVNKALNFTSEVKAVIENPVVPIIEMGMKANAVQKVEKLNKTLCTVTIGIGPIGRNYKVGASSMTANEVLILAQQLR